MAEDPATFRAINAQFPMAVRVSPDGSRVLTKIRHESTFELIIQDVVGLGRRISTIADESQFLLSWAPDSNRIAYLARPRAGKPFNVYLWDLASNTIGQVAVPSSREASAPVKWSSLGDRFLYVANTEKMHRLQLVTLEPNAAATEIGIVTGTHAYAWSPNGTEFLAVLKESPGSVTVYDYKGRQKQSLSLPEAEEIESFGWSRSGHQMILSLRKRGEEWLRLARVDRASGQSEDCVTAEADLKSPTPLSDHEFLFQVSGGARTLIGRGTCRASFRIVGPREGIVEPHFVKDKRLHALFSSPERPAELIAIGPDASETATVYAPPRASDAAIKGPERVRIPLMDGSTIPGLLWRSPERTGKVVVNAHGGPHLPETSQWDLLTSVIASSGADYLTANYHGTPGYGYSFGRSDDMDQHVSEVISACQYAIRNLQPQGGRIILVGVSYGAYLAGSVARQRPELVESVALLSMLRAPKRTTPAVGKPRVRLLQFHGADDDFLSPDEARKATETLLGSGAT